VNQLTIIRMIQPYLSSFDTFSNITDFGDRIFIKQVQFDVLVAIGFYTELFSQRMLNSQIPSLNFCGCYW